MNEPGNGSASHIEQWLDAEPELRLARLFVAQARDPRVALIEAISQQLHAALFGVQESHVAQAKLAWWLDELAQAPRHPLTRQLFESCDPQSVGGALREVAAAMLRLSQRDSIESLEQLLDPLSAAAAGVIRARAAAGADPRPARIAPRSLALARLLAAARDWPRFARPERSLLPLDLLARLRVDRAGAAGAAAVAATTFGALREQLQAIDERTLRGIDGARVAAAGAWARSLLAAPQAAVDGLARAPRVSLVLALWRVGRRG